MNSHDRSLAELLRTYWATSQTVELAEKIVVSAVQDYPRSALVAVRALEVVHSQDTSSIRDQVQGLEAHTQLLLERVRQVHDLGDPDSTPAAIFSILGDEATGIQLEDFNAQKLAEARRTQGSRAAAAQAFLDAFGWNLLPKATAAELRDALDDLRDRETYASWGLFVHESGGVGLAFGLEVHVGGGEVHTYDTVDEEMRRQADVAIGRAFNDKAGARWAIELATSQIGGNSIGLPLYIGALVAAGRVNRDALTAATGKLDLDGRVRAVTGIPEKVEAARRLGMRRLLLPAENKTEVAEQEGIQVLFVENVSDVLRVIQQPLDSTTFDVEGRVRFIRASIPNFGLMLDGEKTLQNAYRIEVSNSAGRASIDVYTGSKGTVKVVGPASAAKESADQLVAQLEEEKPQHRDTCKFTLPKKLQSALHDRLVEAGATELDRRDHQVWRFRLERGGSRGSIVLYTSNTCMLEAGTAPAWDELMKSVRELLPSIECAERKSEAQSENLDESTPHIGTDEAGKGDYFGPLVSAAVFVDAELVDRLRALGVKDSKTLTDKRVRAIASAIRSMPNAQFYVTPINPPRFNQLYQQFRKEGKNLNTLLAWNHAMCVEQLIAKQPPSKRIKSGYVLVDQFADARYIKTSMEKKKISIDIAQRTKAEADIAVAAASILARDRFLEWLEKFSEKTGITLPKGASTAVIEAAKDLVRTWGPDTLRSIAKLNFKTTQNVLDGEDLKGPFPTPPWRDDAAESATAS